MSDRSLYPIGALLLTSALFSTRAATAQTTFTNSAPVVFADAALGVGVALNYPIPLVCSGMSGSVVKVSLRLNALTHLFPGDIDALLVGPDGVTNCIVMSDACGSSPLTAANIVLDDAASTLLPASVSLLTGATATYKPCNYGGSDTFPSPAPAASAATSLSVFNGTNPNGTWKLYLVDDTILNAGVLEGGYSLTITTSGDVALPVELSSFTGSASENGVALNWTTATEHDNAGFTVRRDGVEVASFRNLSTLRGQGTTAQPTAYSYTDTRVRSGARHTYTLTSTDLSGAQHIYDRRVEVTMPELTAPVAFSLSAATPNPFNPTTTLRLSLPEAANVTAVLFDALGRPVRDVYDGPMNAGADQPLTVQADGLVSGAYFFRVTAGGVSGTRTTIQQMTLVK